MSKSVNIMGKIIKQERKRLNISQDELADMLGVSRTQIWKWEKEKDFTPIHSEYFLTEMARIFDCDIDYLRGLQKERHKSETNIMDITGLNADTIQALVDLHKQTAYNNGRSELARKRLNSINALIVNLLTCSGQGILDNMYELHTALSRIKEIESSDIYNMSAGELLKAQLEDPEISGYDMELNELKQTCKNIKRDLSNLVQHEIEKMI